jgi:hypothetical protein
VGLFFYYTEILLCVSGWSVFKISFFIKKRDDVTIEDFRDYWLGEHAEQQKDYLDAIGVRQYLKCEALPDHPMTKAGTAAYDTGPLRYDFIDHWICNDIEELRRGGENPAVQALMQAAHDSEDAWVDVQHSSILMSTDLVQFYPVDAEDVRATPGSSYLKIYYPVRILPNLTRQQAQLHWNACHGAESRQHIKYSSQKKYIQAHAIDSTFVDQLSAKRGYEIDPTFIGHAEGWVDQFQAAKDFPEEETAEIARMTMDDIDLFADKKRGSVFFAQEHYILDNTVITRPDPRVNSQPMPAFFSGVY